MDKKNFHIEPKDSVEFLLSEFRTAWSMLEAIDNRRGIYFNYYNVAFFSVTAFLANLLNTKQQSIFALIISFLICISFVFAGYKIINALKFENKASIRYRNKMNIIREIFLLEDENNNINNSEKIKHYLGNRGYTGARLFTSEKIPNNEIGGALKNLICIIHIEQFISATIALFSLCLIFTPICARLTLHITQTCYANLFIQ